MIYRYKCDLLIDQSKYIGLDPIGYSCFNNAEYEHNSGLLICERCMEILAISPERITFPISFGITYQTKILNNCINSEMGLNDED